MKLKASIQCCCVLSAGAAKTDLVFVQNATTGNNAVIRSVVKTLKPGDSILTTSVTYGEHLWSFNYWSTTFYLPCPTSMKSYQGLLKREGLQLPIYVTKNGNTKT